MDFWETIIAFILLGGFGYLFDKRLTAIENHLTNHVTDTMKEISDLKERTKGLEKDMEHIKVGMDKVIAWIDKQPK